MADMHQMKITAGMGTLDDYIPFAEAGADELFCGFVPFEWMEEAGIYEPLNRREVLYYNVQIGSLSELEILAEMMRDKKVPVTIALNALHYDPSRYPLLRKIVGQCMKLGFTSYIIADPDLIRFLDSDKVKDSGKLYVSAGSHDSFKKYKTDESPSLSIHLSGEVGVSNRFLLSEMADYGISRMIFGRETQPQEMKSVIEENITARNSRQMEYEAFILNERCHYTGAYCNSLHCDAFSPACRIPYVIGERDHSVCDRSYDEKKFAIDDQSDAEEPKLPGFLPGASGCGLCALWQLHDAGVTHLKVVSRGNYSEDTILNIRALRRARTILGHSSCEEEYLTKMRKELFPSGCSHNCYYKIK